MLCFFFIALFISLCHLDMYLLYLTITFYCTWCLFIFSSCLFIRLSSCSVTHLYFYFGAHLGFHLCPPRLFHLPLFLYLLLRYITVCHIPWYSVVRYGNGLLKYALFPKNLVESSFSPHDNNLTSTTATKHLHVRLNGTAYALPLVTRIEHPY